MSTPFRPERWRAVPRLAFGLACLLGAAPACSTGGDVEPAPTESASQSLSEGFTFKVTSDWGSGFCAEMGVTNNTGAALNGWTITFQTAPNVTLTSLWEGQWTANGNTHTVKNPAWGGTLAAGATATFGFCGNNSAGTVSAPTNCTLNGQSCGGGTQPPPVDVTAPTIVQGLSVVSKSQNSVALAWQASSDNVGVTGYEVFIGGGASPVATATGTSATVSGLAPQTAYSFTVKARDAAGNRSTASTALSVTTDGTTVPPPPGNKRLIAYFTQWGIYGRGYTVKSIDTRGTAAKLTHLNYAFGNVVNGKCGILAAPQGDAWADYQKGYDAATSVDGQADAWDQALKGNFNQLKKLKAKYPNLKVLISLGGWTWSGGFSDAASTAQKRATLAQSCIDLYIRGNLPEGPAGAAAGVFDGIDIDWEYPAADGLQPGRPEDTANFTALLAEFRRQLDAVRPGLLLTIAAGSGPDKFSKLELANISQSLDFINIMTYDMHGGWETTTNFHAPLYNAAANPAKALRYSTDESVQGFRAGGVPASKLVVGLPFYGRGWQGTQPGPAGDGLYQATSGAAKGNWDDWSSGNTGIFDYHYIQSTLAPGATKYRHPESRVPYLYNPSTGIWVSYDDATSLGEKAAYIRAQGLGGAMVWELSGDDAQGSLATALHGALNP